MNTRAPFRISVFLLALAGAGLMLTLLLRHGLADITAAIASAGSGVALVIAIHLAPLLVDARAWQVLFPPESRPHLGRLFWMRWVGEAINTVLPAAQVGGDIARARLVSSGAAGVPLPVAAASVIGDITLGVFSQFLFTLSGVALLAAVTGRAGWLRPTLLGSLIAAGAVGGFYAVQRAGIFRLLGTLLARLSRSREWTALVEQGESLDRAVRSLYARPLALLSNVLWTSLSLAMGAAELWIALRVLRMPAGYTQAWILESIGQGVRAAMFLVPAALGVQEGGYLVVGGLLGIPPDIALALALIRRARELLFGVSGVVIWQLAEGRRLLVRPAAAGHLEAHDAP